MVELTVNLGVKDHFMGTSLCSKPHALSQLRIELFSLVGAPCMPSLGGVVSLEVLLEVAMHTCRPPKKRKRNDTLQPITNKHTQPGFKCRDPRSTLSHTICPMDTASVIDACRAEQSSRSAGNFKLSGQTPGNRESSDDMSFPAAEIC